MLICVVLDAYKIYNNKWVGLSMLARCFTVVRGELKCIQREQRVGCAAVTFGEDFGASGHLTEDKEDQANVCFPFFSLSFFFHALDFLSLSVSKGR